VHLPDKMVTINATLSPRKKKRFSSSSARIKMFLHGPPVTYGVSAEISLSIAYINPNIKSKKQKLRKMTDEKVAAVKAEVQRLLDANVIREVKYPTWLANTVPVKKKNGK